MERKNPYTPDTPVQDRRHFFGREEALAWIRTQMETAPPPSRLVMVGPKGMGKTSLLWQVQREAWRRIIPIYVDLAEFAVDSLSVFYATLAETAVFALNEQEVTLSIPEETDFVDAPQDTFEEQVLRPLLSSLNGRRLFFLFDHVTSFVRRLSQSPLSSHSLAAFADMLSRNSPVGALFTVTELPPSDEEHPLAFLAGAPHYTLGPLSPEAALALIRQPGAETMVRDVARYMIDLTGGEPAALQRLGHALHRWRREWKIAHLTVADVVTVWQGMPAAERAGANIARALPPYRLESEPSAGATRVVRRGGVRGWWSGALLIFIGIVIVGTATFLNGWPGDGGEEGSVVAPATASPAATAFVMGEAEIGTETAVSPSPSTTPTATATPTPSPLPTLTPTATETPSPTATPTPGQYPEVIVREKDEMPMRFVPGGSFTMGAEAADVLAGADEAPQHLVLLNSFYIDQYEVTVEQYAAFLNQQGGYEGACAGIDCILPRGRVGYTSYLVEEAVGDGTVRYAPLTGFADYPVNHVSWYGARAYCQWVDARLPTEAEWEYAARGDDGRTYPWGNEPPDPSRAVFQSRDFDNMKPVDALPEGASPFGVYGLAGSLWEWTADWYDEDYYEESPSTNPTGPESGLTRSLRGGAWPFNNEADRIRATNRWSLDPAFISATVGFRCARSVIGNR